MPPFLYANTSDDGEIAVTIMNVAVNATGGKLRITEQGGVLTLMPAAHPEDPISFG